MSNSNYNKIISTINSVSSSYSYVPDPNNLICIDSSNNRIGINTLNPMYSIDASGGTIKADNFIANKNILVRGDASFNNNLDVTRNATISGNLSHRGLIPNIITGLNGNIFNIDQIWEHIFTINVGDGNYQDVIVSDNDAVPSPAQAFPNVGGSYMLSIYSDDREGNPSHYNTYYTGVFSWIDIIYTNDISGKSQSIPLHGYGHSFGGVPTPPALPFDLRTQVALSSVQTKLALQIRAPNNGSGLNPFTFTLRIRRML